MAPRGSVFFLQPLKFMFGSTGRLLAPSTEGGYPETKRTHDGTQPQIHSRPPASSDHLAPAQDFLRERRSPRTEVTSTKTALKFFVASRYLALSLTPDALWENAEL